MCWRCDMSYQQQSFTVNINVRGMGVTGGTGNGTGDTNPEKLNAEEQAAADAAKAHAAKVAIAMNNFKQQGIAAAKQLIFGGAQYYVSGIEMRTGDQFIQAQAQKTLDNVQLGISIGQGMLSGAITGGAAFGAVGAIAGAVIGAASPLISRGFEYEAGLRNYNFQVWKNASNVNYARARAELTETTGRSRVR